MRTMSPKAKPSGLYWLVFQRLWNFTDRQRRVHQVTLDHDLLRCQCRRPDLGRMLETSQATHEALVPATAAQRDRQSSSQSGAMRDGSLGSSSVPTRRGTGSRFPSPAATAAEAAVQVRSQLQIHRLEIGKPGKVNRLESASQRPWLGSCRVATQTGPHCGMLRQKQAQVTGPMAVSRTSCSHGRPAGSEAQRP